MALNNRGASDSWITSKEYQASIMLEQPKSDAPLKATFVDCHQVFTTTELLEEILAHLPTKDLLFAQGICRTWKNCIASSQRLQRGLFFQIPETRSETDVTKILLSKPWSFLMPDDPDVASIRKTVVNLLLRDVFSDKFLGLEYAVYWARPKPYDPSEYKHGDIWDRPEASWRRMHLCYPELKRVETRSISEDFFPKLFWDQLRAITAEIPGGIPMIRAVYLSRCRLPQALGFPDHFTRSWGRHVWKTLVKSLKVTLGELISWMHECETTAELEAYLATVA